MTQTLFDKYGGFAKVSKVVLDFYNRLLDHDELGPYFDDIDMGRIVDHQTKFIASVLGGPASFTDLHIQQVHKRLAIRPADFDELKRVLGGTLADHGFDPADVETVLAEIERRRTQVVG